MRKNIERMAQRETGRNLRDNESRLTKLETLQYPYVGLTGDETIAGVKTFTGTIKVGDDALATGKFNVSGDSSSAATFNRYIASSAAATFSFQKSRHATIGNHTIVQASDELGRLNWNGSDGAAFITGARIVAKVDGTPGTSDMPTRLEFNTTADGASTVSLAATIDSTQRLILEKFYQWPGLKYVATQFDKTNTTLANITGLSVDLVAGRKYRFRAVLHITADATGGHKVAIAGTATATSIIYQIQSVNNGTSALAVTSRQTALAGSAGQAGATTVYCAIEGQIVVNAAGTLTVQFAQNAANGTSSVIVGSTFEVIEMA